MWKVLILILSVASCAFSQSMSTSATITDSDGQAWANGTWKVQLYSPNGRAYYNNTPVDTSVQSGALNGTGGFSGVSLNNTDTITPRGAQYSFTICSNTSALCSTFNTSVTSADLSSVLSALVKAPRFPASPQAYGYLDGEVSPVPIPGGGYFNVVSNIQRVWNGSIWTNASGAGANPGGTTGSFQFNNNGSFGGVAVSGVVRGNGSSAPSAAGFADIIGLWSGASCSGTNVMQANGLCVPQITVGGAANDVQLNIGGNLGADTGFFEYDRTNHFLSANSNGFFNTDLYINGAGNNGLSNLLAGSCSSGSCTAMYPNISTSTEYLPASSLTNSTHVLDFRSGSQGEYFRNPVAAGAGGRNYAGNNFSGAKTFYANWDAATPLSGSYAGQSQNTLTFFNSFSSPGFNFGTWGGPYLGSLWSVQKGLQINQTINTQGIGQIIGGMQDKFAEGDSGAGYFYNNTDGGFKDGSGEGSDGLNVNVSEHSTWFHGTANAGSTTGSQLLQATYVAGTYSRPQTSTGGIMLDISYIPYSGHVTGVATSVPGITAWATPVDFAVTPSTAYGIASAAIPDIINRFGSGQSDTINFTVMGGTNAGGYTTGIGCLLGAAFNEQVSITAVGTLSGGSQSVTFTHRYPDAQAGTSLWQGGPCGTYYVPTATTQFMGQWRVAYPVVGATDSSHIVGQFSNGGAVRQAIPNFWNVASANVHLQNLSISGTTVTANFYSANTSKQFDGMANAVISNATNATYNGNITNVKLTNNNQGITWTQSGPSGTSSDAYISLTPIYFAFALIGGAQVTQPATSAGIPLEPNNVPWTNGSVLENVFDPSFRGDSFGAQQTINSPDSALQGGVGNIGISAQGNGISGQYKFFSAQNLNSPTMYRGGGGLLDAPLRMNFLGPSSSLIKSDQAPMDGSAYFSLGCFISTQGGCGNSPNDYKVISIDNGAGQFNYTPTTQDWYLNNIKTARSRANINSTGDGSYVNGGIAGGAAVALTAASAVNGNASAGLGAYGTFGNETVLDASARIAAKGFYAGEIIGGALSPTGVLVGTRGTAGTTTYSYACTSVTQFGESLPSTTGIVATGNATLSGTNFNAVQCLPGYGSQSLNVYRMSTVGSYAAGLICSNVPNKNGFSTTVNACSDTGQAAGALAPTKDTTGKVQSSSGIFNTLSTSSFSGTTSGYSMALGPAAGTGATGLTCVSGYTCDSISGQVSFTSGTATPTNGAIVIITTGITRASNPACVVNINGPITPPWASSTTTTISINTTGAVPQSVLITASYVCGGN